MTALNTWLALPLLAIAAAFDVGGRRIPNWLNCAVAVVGAAAVCSRDGAAGLLPAAGAAALVFAVLLPVWRLRALGGGDLKLAVACAVWIGLGSLGAFALASAVAGGVIAAICWGMSARNVRREVLSNLALAARSAMPAVTIAQGGGRVSVPYGAAFAAAAAWTLVMG